MRKLWAIPFFLFLVIIMTGCGSKDVAEKSIDNNPKNKVVASNNPSETNSQENQAEVSQETKMDSKNIKVIRDEREGVIPVKLEIPAIGVKADVEQKGLEPNGQMGVPSGSKNVAWYKNGAKPGEPGSAAIAGHVDDTVNPAVFYDLKKLKKGDEVYVTGKDGKKLTFVVNKIEVYPRENAPLNKVFGFTYQSTLNLITCEGKYDPKTTERAERLVVYTELKTDKS